MKLPNVEQAFIDIEKLRNYCLSLQHPRGRNKAKIFVAKLGITADKSTELRDAILKSILSEEAKKGEKDDFGQRYTVDLQMTGKNNTVKVRTGWIVRQDEDFPRLTTCYIL